MDIHTIYYILAWILLIIGVALAVFGVAIWDMLLSAFGGMLGWMIGFGIGISYFGYGSWTGIILAIVIGIIGSIIMAAIFEFLVEAALSLLAGILVAGMVYVATGEIMYAAIVCIVVTVVAYLLIEHVVAIVTAFIGAILAAMAIWYLWGANLAILSFILLFIFGAMIQHYMLDEYDFGR